METIRQSYSWSPVIGELLDICRSIEDPGITNLADLNIRIIEAFASRLHLTAAKRFHRSSTIATSESRIDRLASICNHLGCVHYLSPEGAGDYLERDSFQGSGVDIEFNAFVPPAYQQQGSAGFTAYLSIVDVVANLGWNGAHDYICE